MEFTENSSVEEYLAHFGILGQKWGIRRFQNPDGSLTEAGKKRYLIKGTEIDKRDLKTPEGRAKARIECAKVAINEVLPDEKSKKEYQHAYEEADKANWEAMFGGKDLDYDEIVARRDYWDNIEFEMFKKMMQVAEEKGNAIGIKTDDKEYPSGEYLDAIASELAKTIWAEGNKNNKEYLDKLEHDWFEEHGSVKHSGLTEDSPVSDFISHYGIPKMKWGIRRYQNEDGSLTALGRIHYGLGPHIGKGKNVEKSGKESKSSESTASEKVPTNEEIVKSGDAKTILKYKDQLSDEELRKAYDRANTVRNLQNLIPTDAKAKNPSLFDRGVKYVKDEAIRAIANETTAAIKTGATLGGEKLIKNLVSDPKLQDQFLKAIGAKTNAEKAKDARDKQIKQVIESSDPKKILENITKMTNQEVAEAAKRMDNIYKISDPDKANTVREELIKKIKETE